MSRGSDLPTPPSIAIVAALEREVWPFIKDWTASNREHEGRWFKFYQKDNTVAVCGGIGSEAARRAAEAIIQLYHPALVISAGFAGALNSGLHVGDTFVPRHVIDAADGSRSELDRGEGILVTFDTIADVEQKARLATAFGAHAVDMEAAAVARAAQARGVQFLACKVISDTSGQGLPPLEKFIAHDGRFQMSRYAAHIAFRPWLWGRVVRLARDTAVAARALSARLDQHRSEEQTMQPHQNSAMKP